MGRSTAAKPIKKKAVFCLDNISSLYSADDVRAYVSSLSIDVVSCFRDNLDVSGTELTMIVELSGCVFLMQTVVNC